MNEIRELIQAKLDELEDIEIGPETPDDILEKGKTYFSYKLRKNFVSSDFEKNHTYRINLNGYLKRLNDSTENTLMIIDEAQDKIANKLKEINFKCSYDDISLFDNVRKVSITGDIVYNEINKGID